MSAILLRHDDGPVTTLTLNTPANLNALSSAMLLALDAALTALTPHTRVLILTATGRTFCAGHDLRELQALRAAPDHGRAAFTTLFSLCAAVMQRLADLPQPTIAAVQGVATAAGCQLAASCDFIVAGDTARFGVNGVNIGLFCTTPLVALSRKIPAAQAFALAATGRFLTAPEAKAQGLVTTITPTETLDLETQALAATLAAKLPAALAFGKRARHDPGLAAAYASATATMIDNLMHPMTAEGLTAFLEKRAPNWP